MAPEHVDVVIVTPVGFAQLARETSWRGDPSARKVKLRRKLIEKEVNSDIEEYRRLVCTLHRSRISFRSRS
jgi:hypothetical protein